MHIHNLHQWQHSHHFHVDDGHAERNSRRVIVLTICMMLAEIIAGIAFGSMALLADGWHMGTHAIALGITAFAYYYARRHADNPEYSFGTGKVGVLGRLHKCCHTGCGGVSYGRRVCQATPLSC